MPLEVLLRTKCGSHAWGMERPESDNDWFTVYRTPTKDILRSPTGVRGYSIRNKQVEDDDMKHEAGFVAHMLQSGNINFIIGVMSPAVDIMTPEGERLRKILTNYPAKGVYDSANGLAKSNFQKYIVMGLEDTPKKRALIMRTILFATGIIEKGAYDFGVVKRGQEFSMDDLGAAFRKLREVHQESTLRGEYPKDLLSDWLYDTRMKSLKNDGLIP